MIAHTSSPSIRRVTRPRIWATPAGQPFPLRRIHAEDPTAVDNVRYRPVSMGPETTSVPLSRVATVDRRGVDSTLRALAVERQQRDSAQPSRVAA